MISRANVKTWRCQTLPVIFGLCFKCILQHPSFLFYFWVADSSGKSLANYGHGHPSRFTDSLSKALWLVGHVGSEVRDFFVSGFKLNTSSQEKNRPMFIDVYLLAVSPNKNSWLSQLGTGIEHHWTTNSKNQASIHPVLCASMHDSKSEFKTQTIPSTNQPYLVIEVGGTTEISKEGCHPYQKNRYPGYKDHKLLTIF